MHKLAKEIMDRVKSKINTCGIDGITEQELIEMKYWTCVADAMTSYDYHYKIIEEMEKPENEYGVNYDENGRYYTQPRMSNGQFRRDMRRGYDERYDMSPMYHNEMDRMYYSDNVTSGNMSGNSNGSMRNYSDSRYERARRGYEEHKKMNPESEDMDKLKEVFEELKDEMKDLKPHMSANAKSYARNELTNMANGMV